jgi:hypothetical protein
MQPGCDSLEEVGVAIALDVAKRTAKSVDEVLPPRQYHAVWIRIEAIARSLVRSPLLALSCGSDC